MTSLKWKNPLTMRVKGCFVFLKVDHFEEPISFNLPIYFDFIRKFEFFSPLIVSIISDKTLPLTITYLHSITIFEPFIKTLEFPQILIKFVNSHQISHSGFREIPKPLIILFYWFCVLKRFTHYGI